MNRDVVREQQVEVGPVVINYVEGPATGPPLVILHGGSARWQYGSALIDALSAHWHVYAPDFRGHGKSSWVPGQYRLRHYADDTASFLHQVVGEPAVLYGHSLGGEVAVMVVAEHPELVRALIVGDAPLGLQARHPTEEPAHRAQNLLWRDLAASDLSVEKIAEALKEMPLSVPDEQEIKRAGDVFGEESPWFVFQAENLQLLDPEMLDAVLAGPKSMLEGYDGQRLLPAISCPVLILQADPALGMLADSEVEAALRLLRYGSRVRLAGIGHELHGLPAQISRVLQAIMPFIERL